MSFIFFKLEASNLFTRPFGSFWLGMATLVSVLAAAGPYFSVISVWSSLALYLTMGMLLWNGGRLESKTGPAGYVLSRIGTRRGLLTQRLVFYGVLGLLVVGTPSWIAGYHHPAAISLSRDSVARLEHRGQVRRRVPATLGRVSPPAEDRRTFVVRLPKVGATAVWLKLMAYLLGLLSASFAGTFGPVPEGRFRWQRVFMPFIPLALVLGPLAFAFSPTEILDSYVQEQQFLFVWEHLGAVVAGGTAVLLLLAALSLQINQRTDVT